MKRRAHGSRKLRSRPDRVELRVTREQKELFQRAADLQGMTMTEFVTTALHSSSATIIKDAEILALTARDREVFLNALVNPPAPNRKLLKAAGQYKKLLGL